jgi:hypothetical protein
MRRISRHLTYANVMVTLLAFIVLTGGTAVALNGSNTVFSDDIVNNEVSSADVRDDQGLGGLKAVDLAAASVRGAEVADFTLSNQDIGVLFAEVKADGTLDNSSGGVTTVSHGSGNYDVDFARNIAACTAVATPGPSTGSILPSGEVSLTDTPGNAESVSVITWSSDGTSTNKPFRLVVVC